MLNKVGEEIILVRSFLLIHIDHNVIKLPFFVFIKMYFSKKYIFIFLKKQAQDKRIWPCAFFAQWQNISSLELEPWTSRKSSGSGEILAAMEIDSKL